jgi:alkanesulfonate monooxygenase SsuD/methylene tetrahydromethanopterin reductase-like flavin-dependent oxidoreductase (luciferase family)
MPDISFGLSNITCQRHPSDHRPGHELYAEALELAQEAERLGFDSVWCSEHHFYANGYLPSPLVLCAAVAARTQRLRVGTSTLQPPLYNTLRLAEDAAVVDLISGGRLTLGVGQGWKAEEFEALGVPLRGRHRRFEEQVRTLRHAWGPDPVDGRVTVTPKPARANGPLIYFGAAAEAAVRRAGRMADGFLASALGLNAALGLGPAMTPARFAQIVGWLTEELEATGRDVRDFAFCLSLPTVVFDDDAVWEEAREHHWTAAWAYFQLAPDGGPPPAISPEAEAELRRTAMVGPPELIIERLRAFADLAPGRFEFHARMLAPGIPPDLLGESMRRFSREVIPAFR